MSGENVNVQAVEESLARLISSVREEGQTLCRLAAALVDGGPAQVALAMVLQGLGENLQAVVAGDIAAVEAGVAEEAAKEARRRMLPAARRLVEGGDPALVGLGEAVLKEYGDGEA